MRALEFAAGADLVDAILTNGRGTTNAGPGIRAEKTSDNVNPNRGPAGGTDVSVLCISTS